MRKPGVEVVNNTERRQFEIHEGEHLARLTYRLRGDVLDLIHTEVPRELEGQGYANELATAALEYAAQNSLLVKPTCPFVQAFIIRHPSYARLTSRTDD